MEEGVMYPRECECGKVVQREHMWVKHVESKSHAVNMEQKGFVMDESGEYTKLPSDLQTIINFKEYNINPRNLGRMVRVAFAVRGWPNKEHPGTVVDFMKEHRLPTFDIGRGAGWTAAEGNTYITNRVKEYMGVK